jgi:hypothetical protein
MLDSGAYASWRKGDVIDLYDYIEFIKRHQDILEYVINLDIIPGVHKTYPTPEEVEDSARRSYENQQIMKAHGLSPIPVFHQGESFSWLKRYMDDGEPYIGISPLLDIQGWKGADPDVWLDQAFDFVTDANGYPLVKTHGFGIVSVKYLKRYPWTSVDATSYTQVARFGKILVPLYRNGKPDYLSSPLYVHLSEVTQRKDCKFMSARDKAKDQFGNLGRIQQDQVIHFVTQECGLTMTEVRYCDNHRRKAVIKFWAKVVEAVGDVPRFRHKTRWRLFDQQRDAA